MADDQTIIAVARWTILPAGFWGVALAENSQGVIANCVAQQMPANVATVAVVIFNHKWKIGKPTSKNINAHDSTAPASQWESRLLSNNIIFPYLCFYYRCGT